MRFDEVELAPVIFDTEAEETPAEVQSLPHAPRFKRLLALLTDLSLFVALSLALSPLLPANQDWISIAALGGFVVIVSFYYFAGCWLLWGKTVGGAIFDVRIVPAGDDALLFSAAAQRWVALYLSLLTGGIGFLLAALPSRLSLSDRLSNTRSVV